MTLYFLRHGNADQRDWRGRDEDRPLTREGIETMRHEARTLARMGLTVQRVITSPLVRARETAEIAARALASLDVLDVDPRLAPGFSPTALTEIVVQHAGLDSLMLVGHEPDFSATIGAVIGGARVVMKKGGLARVDIISPDPLRGGLIWLLPPRALTV